MTSELTTLIHSTTTVLFFVFTWLIWGAMQPYDSVVAVNQKVSYQVLQVSIPLKLTFIAGRIIQGFSIPNQLKKSYESHESHS